MVGTRLGRRRAGLLAALLLPMVILLQSLATVDAQFPKPPGGFNPPGGGLPGGGKFGPKTNTFEWRCSKCGAVVATTNNGIKPNLSDCPRCGAHFINGGKSTLTPPPNLPPAGPGPGTMPPGGPPPLQPPAAGPPNPAPPANPQPRDAGPVDPPAPNDPPVAAGDQAAAPRRLCSWCPAEVNAGTDYCTTCKLKIGAVILAGGVVAGALVIVLTAAVLWACLRGRQPTAKRSRKRED